MYDDDMMDREFVDTVVALAELVKADDFADVTAAGNVAFNGIKKLMVTKFERLASKNIQEAKRDMHDAGVQAQGGI
jgi:hypothetical protein